MPFHIGEAGVIAKTSDQARQLDDRSHLCIGCDNHSDAVLARDDIVDPFQRPESHDRQHGRGGAKHQLTAAQAETDHRDQPQRRRGGDAGDEIAFLENGPGADEADAGEDAER